MAFRSNFAATGANDFHKLSKALKKAGEKELRKDLHKGLQLGAKPLIPLTRAAALAKLPKKGGLNKRMAKAPQRVRVNTGRNPGVSLVLPKKQDGYIDGRIRHPVFEKDKGARKGAGVRGDKPVKWVEQKVDGTWFDDTIRDNADQVLPALKAAFDETVKRVIREVGR